MKAFAFIYVLLFHATDVMAQSVSGQLSQYTQKEIKLEGFNGTKSYNIGSATSDIQGKFTINYTANDYGMGYLITPDSKPFLVLLSGETIEIYGVQLANPETITIKIGKENLWFEQFAKEHSKREQALSAWEYLEKLYTSEAIFANQKKPSIAIQQELQRIKSEETAFLESLPKDSYVRWFIPTRKFVSSIANIAQYRSEEIPATIAAFRKLDYSDSKLYKSGLLKDAIEGHFWLLENSGQSIESVTKEMKTSIDALFVKLISNEKILNEVTDYLFELLEKHSLFEAAEYLAFKVQTEVSCKIDDNLARQLETYRAMKVGNTAPDILFNPIHFVNDTKIITSLSGIKSAYKLVIFGASWCPNCQTDYPGLIEKYTSLQKKYNIEFVYLSIDSDKNQFEEYYKSSPFMTYCDGKGWETQAAKDYYVFGTPTYLLLDANLKILVKLKSPNHLQAWMENFGKVN
jgi:thiol-disulfide isomerase/thioredoxin